MSSLACEIILKVFVLCSIHTENTNLLNCSVGDWIKIAQNWITAGFANKAVEIYKILLAADCATADIYSDLGTICSFFLLY